MKAGRVSCLLLNLCLEQHLAHTLSKDILVVVHPFTTHHFYHDQDCTQEYACMGACETDASPSSPSLGNIPKSYFVPPHQKKWQIKQKS